MLLFFFFFNDTATTEIYTLSLHDALPIWSRGRLGKGKLKGCWGRGVAERDLGDGAEAARDTEQDAIWVGELQSFSRKWGKDRKSTRLNSSHLVISYAVFCLKKKNIRS